MNRDCHHLWTLWEKDLPWGAAVLLEEVSLGQAIQSLVWGGLVWDPGWDHRGHSWAQAWLQCGGAEWPSTQPKAAPSGRGWSLCTVGQGSLHYTSSELALALALKKSWKKVSPSAVRAALRFSLKHLKAKFLNFLRCILPGPLKTSMRQEQWLLFFFLVFPFLSSFL